MLMQRIAVIMLFVCCFSDHSAAQIMDANDSSLVNFEEELGELDIDVQDSIGDPEERRGFGLDGDLRLGYVFAGDNIPDGLFGETDIFRARWRIRSIWGITNRLRGVLRVAGTCSSEDCDPDFILQPELPASASRKDGQFTIDALFLQWFRTDRFDLAVGRMETKFVARGGVFAKSLDRNDNNNMRVNWTDGLHGTFKAENGWESQMVLQYNSKDGPSNVRRYPLDFSDSRSRVSYFYGLENLQANRLLVQRRLDITYLPSSLLSNGQAKSRLEDYVAIVARVASRWPVRSEDWRIRLSTEVGYASNTPTKTAAGIIGAGDADGLAWNITVSVMDFAPNHNIGINFGKTEAGWLLSPQYTDNERLFEVRYMWRPINHLTLDVRGRWRDELRQRIIEELDRDRFDFYARFTWSFEIREF